MSLIKLGIIGSNFVTDWLCESVLKTEGITLHAMYSRSEARGREFANRYGIEHVITDLDAFLSSDIDAVYIASPNFLHAFQAVKAMEKGKHVLVEKPAALSQAEFDEMTACAQKNGVVLLEAMRPAHDDALKIVRDHLSSIGPVRRAVFEFCQYSSRYDKFRAGEILNAFDPALGNAAVMDIGVYAIAVCVSLFGLPRRITSRSVKLHNGFEGMGTALLDYDTHQAEIVYSKITDSVNPSVITGEDGSLKIGKLSTLDSLEKCIRKKPGEIIFSGRETPGAGNMVYEVRNFVKMVREEMSALPYQNETRNTLFVIDEIRRQNGIEFPVQKL
ncbi:MAG: Gfo/Idh/MocA family oxidoreductase [Clostridia bacterium]|nr:Gfo/Idh/MocA family oxidoreductase [Clostridia bacterium]